MAEAGLDWNNAKNAATQLEDFMILEHLRKYSATTGHREGFQRSISMCYERRMQGAMHVVCSCIRASFAIRPKVHSLLS
jgi:hypothetical protein